MTIDRGIPNKKTGARLKHLLEEPVSDRMEPILDRYIRIAAARVRASRSDPDLRKALKIDDCHSRAQATIGSIRDKYAPGLPGYKKK